MAMNKKISLINKIVEFSLVQKFSLRSNFMNNKKGVFFTIDSILAAGIIFTVIILASSIYVKEQPSFHLNYISQDLVRTLSIVTVGEINNEYLNERITNGDITNLDNTILEQISEFWAEGNMELLNV